jgi:hypothetical protein
MIFYIYSANYVELINEDDATALAEHAEVAPEPEPEPAAGAAVAQGNPPFATAVYDYTADESNEICALSRNITPSMQADCVDLQRSEKATRFRTSSSLTL